MKFSHTWLGQYVTIRETPEWLGERLTAAGIPLDAIQHTGDGGAADADTIYDFDIFTNRPDCMNHVGLARECAALLEQPLRPPETRVGRGGAPTSGSISIDIEDPDLCARYSARCVLGVKVGPSPDWLRRRLESIGQRSINNVVDATNFVLWELGHPLHPFDLDRVSERRIVVRRARAGEMLRTLDGFDHKLTEEMLVIADGRVPVALAGIIGGLASEITEGTKDVLLESAWFDPVSTRRTARSLGLRTDASHRFERGADSEGTLPALDRAATLIAEVAGGSITDPPLDVRARTEPPRVVGFRPARASSLLGLTMEPAAMRTALSRLGFEVNDRAPDSWQVTVPSFRRDVEREVDLIEEVARHLGYDSIPSQLPLLPDAEGGRHPFDAGVRVARRALLAAGLSEAINYVMVDEDDCRLFSPDLPTAIENPLQSQAAFLRSSLLPGLLRNVAHNLNHSLPGCHLFEIGTTFRPGHERPEERLKIAFVLSGRGIPVHWSIPQRQVDVHDARGAAELLSSLLGTSPIALSSDKIPFLASGRALRVTAGDRPWGVVGEIAPAVLERYAIEEPVFGGELDLMLVLGAEGAERRFHALPRFPAVRRDLALVVGRGVTFDAIERIVHSATSVPVAEVQVFDLYSGPGVPRECLSLAIQIVFQHPERTLEADEVQSAQDAIVTQLAERLTIHLRGADPN